MSEELDSKLINLLHEYFGIPIDEISLDDDFKEVYEFDSIDVVEFNLLVSTEFNIDMPINIDHLITVRKMIDYIENKKGMKP